MPRTERGWLVTAEELDTWVLPNPPLVSDDDVLAIDKPAHVVCHPTKHGLWSSLSSAVRERFGLDPVHLISRLDRETSGVVLIGKTREAAARLRVQGRRNTPKHLSQMVSKTYLTILNGELPGPVTVDQPLGRPETGDFRNRQHVVASGQPSVTTFEPIACAGGFTFARARPLTGRMHQIRVHAAWLGHPVVGDKLYPDESLQLAFLEHGWTAELAVRLPMQRQALHASSITIFDATWQAPLPRDMTDFLAAVGLTSLPDSFLGSCPEHWPLRR